MPEPCVPKKLGIMRNICRPALVRAGLCARKSEEEADGVASPVSRQPPHKNKPLLAKSVAVEFFGVLARFLEGSDFRAGSWSQSAWELSPQWRF
jgi:hypothetical protein